MARRATSLGPKPSLFVICFLLFFLFLFFVFFFFCFLSLLFNTKNLFPLRKGIFCIFFGVCLCFSLAFFGLPLFQFLFLCLSLSCSCPFFFLLVCLVCFLLVPCFVFSFSPVISSLLLFHERNNIKIFNCNIFLHQYFLFFWFSVLFVFNSLFLIFAISWF